MTRKLANIVYFFSLAVALLAFSGCNPNDPSSSASDTAESNPNGPQGCAQYSGNEVNCLKQDACIYVSDAAPDKCLELAKASEEDILKAHLNDKQEVKTNKKVSELAKSKAHAVTNITDGVSKLLQPEYQKPYYEPVKKAVNQRLLALVNNIPDDADIKIAVKGIQELPDSSFKQEMEQTIKSRRKLLQQGKSVQISGKPLQDFMAETLAETKLDALKANKGLLESQIFDNSLKQQSIKSIDDRITQLADDYKKEINKANESELQKLKDDPKLSQEQKELVGKYLTSINQVKKIADITSLPKNEADLSGYGVSEAVKHAVNTKKQELQKLEEANKKKTAQPADKPTTAIDFSDPTNLTVINIFGDKSNEPLSNKAKRASKPHSKDWTNLYRNNLLNSIKETVAKKDNLSFDKILDEVVESDNAALVIPELEADVMSLLQLLAEDLAQTPEVATAFKGSASRFDELMRLFTAQGVNSDKIKQAINSVLKNYLQALLLSKVVKADLEATGGVLSKIRYGSYTSSTDEANNFKEAFIQEAIRTVSQGLAHGASQEQKNASQNALQNLRLSADLFVLLLNKLNNSMKSLVLESWASSNIKPAEYVSHIVNKLLQEKDLKTPKELLGYLVKHKKYAIALDIAESLAKAKKAKDENKFSFTLDELNEVVRKNHQPQDMNDTFVNDVIQTMQEARDKILNP